MGCAASKQQVHPDAHAIVSKSANPAIVDDKKLIEQTAVTTTSVQLMPMNDGKVPVEEVKSNEVIRHSAGSLEKNSLDKNVIPAIPGAITSSDTNQGVVKAGKATAFEIPLDDTIKIKARKPASANPKKRLQPVGVSNEELQKKLAEAEAKWEQSNNDESTEVFTEKEIPADKLKVLIAEREERNAENRRRELELKQAKLQQHGQHVKQVSGRKQKMVAEGDIKDLSMSWGGETGGMAMGIESDGPARGSIEAL